ncbi:MAG TPA: CotH kinase family protein [Bacteroidia bacterium]|jgi:hypothetical protein|nr:CotH kinase family protein [Bacteroidia bacterium]
MKRFFLLAALAFTISGKIKATAGDSIWAVPFIHDIYLNYSQTDFYDSLVNTHVTDTYIQTTMIFDGRTMIIGSKFKGNSSYNNPSQKKSFKLDLNMYVPGQDYDGIKKLNLNNGFKDPTMMREKLMLDFCNAHNIPAPRCTYARVYLNNVFWGLYTLVEEVNSKFLRQQYPDDNGALFKGDPSGDLKYYGSSYTNYTSHYELQSDDTLYDWSKLVHLIDIGNNTPAANYYDSLETVLNSWSFLDYLAVCNIFVDLDSYIGSGHNYFLYEDSTYDKFHMIAWDVNEGFGNFNLGMTISQLQNLNYDYLNQPANKPLAQKILADPTYHANYVGIFCVYMADFNNAYMDPKIDSLANMIRNDVYADTASMYTPQNFEDNIVQDIQIIGGPGGGWICGLKPFITARNASLSSQLQPYGCWLGVNEQTVSNSLAVFPNPASDIANIQLPSAWNISDCALTLIDMTGKEIAVGNLTVADHSVSFSTASISNGLYFVNVKDRNGNSASVKFSVSH